MTFVLRGDFEYRDGMWFAGAETALGLGAPVEDGIAEDTLITLQLGVFGGVRPVEWLATGLRFQTVMLGNHMRREIEDIDPHDGKERNQGNTLRRGHPPTPPLLELRDHVGRRMGRTQK